MDQLPPRPRAIPLSEVSLEPPPLDDRTAARSMAHVRDPRDRDRDRDRDRERDRPQYEDGWVPGPAARRDDVYVPVRDAHPPAYGREREVLYGREWTRDGRDRRDERYHRAGGYPERGGWADDRARDRDRERERFREWEREREERAIYERPREQRGWERDERSRDRDGRYGGEGYRSVHPRRQEVDHRYRSPPPPPHLRPRSPPPYVRRSPSPTFRAPTRSPGPRSRDGRSESGTRGDIGVPVRKQRDNSADSRRSGMQRAREERAVFVPRKRERSPSPANVWHRASRKQRTASTSPGRIKAEDEQTTVSPLTTRQEEKQPERASPLPLTAPGTSTADRDREERQSDRERAPAAWPGRQPRRPIRRVAPDTGSIEGAPAVDRERPVPTGPAQRKTPQGALDSTPPSTSHVVPANAPTGPRSAAAQPPPARLPSIPVWTRPTVPNIFAEARHNFPLDSYSKFLEHARPALYAEVARASAAVRWATAEADISTIELRSAEQRRVLAGQLRQQMET
ncbi:hypothetical protein M0805_008953 [Coniferiporia weirii]|nr:hypothetical protein M0805_008953 [Coniferiporia weirii]